MAHLLTDNDFARVGRTVKAVENSLLRGDPTYSRRPPAKRGGSASLPTGQYVGQVWSTVAANESGWDYVRAWGIP